MTRRSYRQGCFIPSRRRFFCGAGAIAASAVSRHWAIAAAEPAATGPPKTPASTAAAKQSSYETQATGMRILPGQWRPHYPWEHIAWISPSWPSQEYIWLDFPEAIFTSQGLLYLSHINPPFPTVFPDLPRVAWQEENRGIAFERRLPNGIVFGGRVTRASDTTVGLELRIRNGSTEKLADIILQTCAYLRAIREFADYTRDNKFVHAPGAGWVPIAKADKLPKGQAPYRVGWRNLGPAVADLPVVVTVSSRGDRLLAYTWGRSTLSMVSNPNHPCVHADPRFPDLAPGEEATIHGALGFFEGPLKDFDPSRLITDKM